MSPAGAMNPTQERVRPVTSGWLMLPVVIALYIAAVVLFVLAFANGTTPPGGEVQPVVGLIIGALVALAVSSTLQTTTAAMSTGLPRLSLTFSFSPLRVRALRLIL